MAQANPIMKGSIVKEWFKAHRPKYRRLLFPEGESFHIANLDEILDNKYYMVKPRWGEEVILERVIMVEEVVTDGDHWWEY